MSAFIVNDKTLNRILTFLGNWDFGGNAETKKAFWALAKNVEDDATHEQILNSIGVILNDLNREAVSQRYKEDKHKSDYFYTAEKCDIKQAYMHLCCLTYQCCEGNIPNTKIYKLLERMEKHLEHAICWKECKGLEWEAKE
ncbi:MAG: hypothetical protein KAQ89_00615 [Planctomycetes bacterium]|nr:hypothetical protein [Planctomycetota bacterium]